MGLMNLEDEGFLVKENLRDLVENIWRDWWRTVVEGERIGVAVVVVAAMDLVLSVKRIGKMWARTLSVGE